MVNAYSIPADKLITRTAVELKERSIINPPEWANHVKTGHFKENMPEDADWFYIRSASVLRKIYTRGPLGVQTLRKLYGNAKNRGTAPNKSARASGAVLRNIVQQLEKNGLIATVESEGRKITPKGMSLLDALSKELKSDFPELERYF